MRKEATPEIVVQEIRRKTRRQFSAEEKIRIVSRACTAKKASPRCAGKKGWPRICITAGVKSFSKLGRIGSSADARKSGKRTVFIARGQARQDSSLRS